MRYFHLCPSLVDISMLSLLVVMGNLFKFYNLEIHAVVGYDVLQFYFRDGRPPSNDIKEQCLSRINDIFNKKMDGLRMHGEMYTSFITLSPGIPSSILHLPVNANPKNEKKKEEKNP